MINGKKVVVVTPAGRRRYLELLKPLLMADSCVDRWDLWLNTLETEDIAYINSSANDKIRVVTSPKEMIELRNFRIHSFFKYAADADTVYIRLDDDIVWYEPGSIQKVVEHRLSNPQPFLVYGNVLNSGLTTYLHQQAGRIPHKLGTAQYYCMCPNSWGKTKICLYLHKTLLADPTAANWYLPNLVFKDYERHSINTICWTGEDASNWANTVGVDEEQWLSVDEPKRTGRPNEAVGNTLFCHFAFHTQRHELDKSDVLDGYRQLGQSTIQKIEAGVYV